MDSFSSIASSGDFSKKFHLTESNLKSLEVANETNHILERVLEPVGEYVGRAQRDSIIRVALQQYNYYFNLFPISSVESFCDMCIRLSTSGYQISEQPTDENNNQQHLPIKEVKDDDVLARLGIAIQPQNIRIPLSSQILNTMLDGVTLAVNKRKTKPIAEKTIHKIHFRANKDLLPDILLRTNALLHLLPKKS